MKKSIIILLIYLLLFTIIFGLTVFNYFHNISVLKIGISAKIVNISIALLSAAAIVKTTWHLYSF